MAQDTHINAYINEVVDAEKGVAQANGRLAAAKEALEAHPDYVAPPAPEPKKKSAKKK